MPQHKPKVDKLNAETFNPPFSGSDNDEVVFTQSPGNTVSEVDAKRFFLRALGFRCISLGLALILAKVFLGHYSANSKVAFIGLSGEMTTLLLILVAISFSIRSIYQQCETERRRVLAGESMKEPNLSFRPVFSYWGWTFMFFVLPFLGNSVYSLLFAAFMIFRSGTRPVWFANRGFGRSSSTGFGFQSFRFKG